MAHRRTSMRGQGRPRSRVATLIAVAMVAGVAAAVVPAQDASATPPGASPGRPVHVHPVAAHQVRIPVLPVARRAPAAWPSAGSATVGLSTATVRAGSLPVLVGPPTGTAPAVGKRTGGLAASPTEDGPVPAVATPLAVSMAAQSTVTALGLHGAVFSVADRSTGTGTAHRVHIALDYSGFADAFGGGFSGRLRLFALPACALTTPKVPACQVETPLDSANDTHAAQVGADVRLPGGSSGDVTSRTLVLAATTSTQGSGGNFGAEPVSEQTQWVTGDSSGAYTYTYPIELPPVPGGMAPTVSLNYDSQSVDGLDASTNNEASSIGDGWSYQPGFIENDYQTCATNPVKPDTLDLCAGTPEQTITLNGSTTPLVVTSAGSAHPEADGAQQVIAQSGGGYEVIEPDGTQYWFGRNKLPGFTTGDATTNSVWTVPLWQTSGFANGVWRYMLDYVVDPNGNAVAYFYNTQTNYYAESNGQTAGTVANGAYTQGGSLAKIEYGLRANSVYTQPPAAQVTFTTGSTVRQDAPTDLACAMGATCHVTAPTFWTSFPLIGISTQALVNSTLTTVDSYSLTQSYPATGDTTTAPSLWLSSITRTGQDGSTPISLPPVSFSGTPMANLAATATDKSAGYSLITRYRLTHIVSDTGAVTTVAYSAESSACASGTFPKDQSNTGLCYPDYWLTNPLSLTDREDWYNLYDTASITNTDTTGGGPAEVASYTYSGPAWHYNADTTSVSANWTWDQWRGFRSVTIEAGTAPDPVAETVDTFLQGMSQDSSDFRFSGGKITNGQVNVTSSRGDVVEDKEQYAGMLFEQIVYNGAGSGNQVYDTIYSPWTSTATGSNSTFFQTSFIVGVSAVATYDALSGGGVRETTTTDTFNGNGQVLTENLVPDTANASENTCTAYTYTVNTTAWIVNLPSEVKVTGGASCATAVSDTRYTYDGGTLTTGNITKVSRLNATASGGTVMENYTYDQYGRTLTSQDPDNRTTITAYTPATGAEPTSVRETDPAGLATTTTYDPARGLETGQTDPAGDASAASYNALGQLTAEWSPGNPTTGPAVDKYAYTISDTAPSVITSQTEQPGGGYLTSDTIYDSLGRSRETQTQTASGGADVSDVSYNSDGVKTLTSDPYYVSSSPSGVLVAAAPSAVPSQTGYVYDGDGRVIKQISYALGVQTWETDTTYGGDHTTVVGPSGGTSDTTFSDGRGLTTAIYQYHSGVPADPADPAGDYDKTTYTYTAAGRLAGVTDAQGNTWSYLYDQLGDELNKTDPDSGTTTDSYDNAGQLTSSTDARGKQVSFSYDPDGRKIGQYDTTGGAAESSATQLASWTYDTLAAGKPTSSTAFVGGAAYTEQVAGYNSQGLPTGTSIVVPASQGALAGTYTQQTTYAPDGALTSYTDSAAGGLPAETVTTGYDSVGDPTSLTGADTYVGNLSYTTLDQPLQYQLGIAARPTYITESYDPQTGRITGQNTQTGTAQTSVDNLHYTYDQAGNVTSMADTPADTSATDVQCFQYDYLARLTQAWSQSSTGCAATPSTSTEGGAAPYWHSYAYNSVGNLTGSTATSPSGAVTTTAQTYPAAGSAQPHAVTTAQVTTSGATTTAGYGYTAAGQLATVTTPSQTQVLTWNDAGQLAQDTVTQSGGGAQTTGYVYDADGNLLLASDPGATTLYLPDEELSLSTGTGVVTGTRYYSLAGRVVATRVGADSLAYVAGDTQGTDSVAIDAGDLTVTRRYYDPYGNPRGPPSASFPLGQKGFVGGTADPGTGLTNLGAREYQPVTGSFTSPDPVVNPLDPQDLNAYAYAQDNPTSDSDPTGLCPSSACEGAHDGPPPPTKYTGPYGCTGATQQAVNDCVKAAHAAQHSNVSRGIGPTPINNPIKFPAGVLQGILAQENWINALEIVKAYLWPNPGDLPTPSKEVLNGVRNRNVTIILSDVTVHTPDGDVNKVIGFINNKGRLPGYVIKDLSENGVQLFRATKLEGHAEMAARDFRLNKALQRKTLGGTVRSVNAAVMNNGACSTACGRALTQYIGQRGIQVNKGGRGFEVQMGRGITVFNAQNTMALMDLYGGVKAFQAIVQLNLDVPLDLPEIGGEEP